MQNVYVSMLSGVNNLYIEMPTPNRNKNIWFLFILVITEILNIDMWALRDHIQRKDQKIVKRSIFIGGVGVRWDA